MITADQIIAEARTWIGVRFLHQGRTRHGVDCVGLVACVMRSLDPSWSAEIPIDYARRPKDGTLLSYTTRYCQRLKRVEHGALVLMQFPKISTPSHVALYTKDGTIIHAHSVTRRVCEVGFRAQWERDFHSTWRLPGVGHE
jgi:cell wall-associated NlpC family hydrolase